jgi:hypothetical protein
VVRVDCESLLEVIERGGVIAGFAKDDTEVVMGEVVFPGGGNGAGEECFAGFPSAGLPPVETGQPQAGNGGEGDARSRSGGKSKVGQTPAMQWPMNGR